MSMQRNETADTRPFWLQSVATAKEIAFDRLSPAEKEQALKDQAEWRKRAKERTEAKLALAKRIFAMHDDGKTAAEIGAALGKSAIAIVKFAAARGVLISQSPVVVHLAVKLTA
jgi:hypothetical protein